MMRRQAYVPNPAYTFSIFEGNPNPAAAVKLCEYIASDVEANMTIARGIKDVLWNFRPDGRVQELFWVESPDKMKEFGQKVGFHNAFTVLWDKNFYQKYYYNKDAEIENTRTWAFNNIYKNYLGPEGSAYVSSPLSTDEENWMKVLSTDITNFRMKTFAEWITTNANIDAEWDTYVAEIKKLHVDEFLALKQKAYDAIMAK
jgi:putative aldouronate transport system substrate-binding protein